MDEDIKKHLKVLEKFTGDISADLMDVTREMLEGGYTKFPIYIMHSGNVELGQMIVDADEFNTPFWVHVSTLEEFQKEGIIFKERTADFKKAYGDPLKNLCIFWVFDQQAGFIFYPIAGRKTDDN